MGGNERANKGTVDPLRARRFLAAGLPFLVVGLVFVVWESVAHSPLVTPFMLPSLESVVGRMGTDVWTGTVFVQLQHTLYRTAIGFSIAGTVGVCLGILMGRNWLVAWFFDPVISAGAPMPKVALLPVFIAWFGLYDFSKIMLVVTSAIFPVVTATALGLRQVERHLIWSAQSLGANERRVMWEIMLPAALPQILTGLQIALPISLIVAIVSEIVMGGNGLGGAMIDAARNLDSPTVFAGIVEMAVTGFCLIKAMELIRQRLLIWNSETALVSAMS